MWEGPGAVWEVVVGTVGIVRDGGGEEEGEGCALWNGEGPGRGGGEEGGGVGRSGLSGGGGEGGGGRRRVGV